LVAGPFLLKDSNWTPAFAGETNTRKAWFFFVIPAEAGIQDELKKMESSLDNFGLINIFRDKGINQPKGIEGSEY
jgi:hypothetical protein